MKTKSSFLLLGPEAGEKGTFVMGLKEDLTESAGSPPEEYRFYPFEADVNEIISILKNGSLFSSYKIVTLYNIDQLKKEEAKRLAEYNKNPCENTTIIYTTDAYQVDAALKKSVPKENVKIFWELFENKKRDWVVSYFRNQNLKVETEAVDLILEFVDNNTFELKRECQRIAQFLSDRDRIGEEDIEQFLYHSKEENIFTLFDKIAVADLESALEILTKLFGTGESHPVQLIAGLQWQFTNLLGIGRLLDQNYSVPDACSKLNIRTKKMQRVYTEAVRRYDTRSSERILILLNGYDRILRSSRADLHPLIFSLLVYSCVVKRGEEFEPVDTRTSYRP
jgi:DNA polymerase III subunit delta